MRGLRLFVTLLKVMVPAYIAVSLLKQTPFLDAAVQAVAPLMRWVGLPPSAAIPLVVAFSGSLYGAIGAMQSLHFTPEQITQIAVVMLIAHNLIVELSITARLRTRWVLIGLFRVTAGLSMGALLHYAFGFNAHASGGEAAFASLRPALQGVPYWLGEAHGLWTTLAKTFCIVIPLMTVLEFVRTGPWLDRLTDASARPLRALGLERESVLPFWAGVILGIAYGAGLIIDATENDNFHGRQAFLVSVFLGLAHALIEDTLLFAALGASLFWVFVPRVAAACVLTWACSRVFARRAARTAAG
jgi:hypothetical protein